MKLTFDIDLVATANQHDVLELVERTAIEQALQLCGGNISATADLLGIYRQTLQRKITRLGIANIFGRDLGEPADNEGSSPVDAL